MDVVKSIRIKLTVKRSIALLLFCLAALLPRSATALSPSVVGIGGGTVDHNAKKTTIDVTVAGTPSAGDLVIVLFAKDGAGYPVWPIAPAFTTTTGDGSPMWFSEGLLSYRFRIWQSGDATSFDLTHASETTAWQVYRIAAGTFDPIAGVVYADSSPAPKGNSAAPEPPPCSAGGSDGPDRLFIAVSANDGSVATSAGPTGYGDFLNEQVASSGGVGIASANAVKPVASDDPGVFTLDSSEQWVAQTLCVAPAP